MNNTIVKFENNNENNETKVFEISYNVDRKLDTMKRDVKECMAKADSHGLKIQTATSDQTSLKMNIHELHSKIRQLDDRHEGTVTRLKDLHKYTDLEI